VDILDPDLDDGILRSRHLGREKGQGGRENQEFRSLVAGEVRSEMLEEVPDLVRIQVHLPVASDDGSRSHHSASF
jgi:hypothetical protein